MSTERKRAKIVVWYDDETTEEFNPNRPRYLLDMEKRYGVQTPERHEHVAWLAYHALVEIPGKDESFDSWIERVDEFESFEPEDEPSGGDDDQGEADPS